MNLSGRQLGNHFSSHWTVPTEYSPSGRKTKVINPNKSLASVGIIPNERGDISVQLRLHNLQI